MRNDTENKKSRADLLYSDGLAWLSFFAGNGGAIRLWVQTFGHWKMIKFTWETWSRRGKGEMLLWRRPHFLKISLQWYKNKENMWRKCKWFDGRWYDVAGCCLWVYSVRIHNIDQRKNLGSYSRLFHDWHPCGFSRCRYVDRRTSDLGSGVDADADLAFV